MGHSARHEIHAYKVERGYPANTNMGEIPCARQEEATTSGELKRDAVVPTDGTTVFTVANSKLQNATDCKVSGSGRSMDHTPSGGQEACTDNTRDARVKILDAM